MGKAKDYTLVTHNGFVSLWFPKGITLTNLRKVIAHEFPNVPDKKIHIMAVTVSTVSISVIP